MNKNTFTTVALEQGEMHIYDFGHLKLHAYQTCDPLSDETFLVEKDGNIVILEPNKKSIYSNEGKVTEK